MRYSEIFVKKIVILSYPLHSTPVRGVPVGISAPLWYGKTRMVSLPENEKKIEDMFIRFDVIHERDRRTDRPTVGRTLRDSINRACIASRGNKMSIYKAQ